MQTTFKVRLAASCKALFVAWFVAGVVFCFVIKGPGTISAWMTWGSGVLIAGWLIIGLPIVALGDRIRHIPYLLFVFLGGLGGAFLMFLPDLLARLLNSQTHYAPFSLSDLDFPSVAFMIAAATAALYRFFLDKAASPRTRCATN